MAMTTTVNTIAITVVKRARILSQVFAFDLPKKVSAPPAIEPDRRLSLPVRSALWHNRSFASDKAVEIGESFQVLCEKWEEELYAKVEQVLKRT